METADTSGNSDEIDNKNHEGRMRRSEEEDYPSGALKLPEAKRSKVSIGGVVDMPALFTVDTCGETGALGFSIEGPSQAKINCKDNGDGSAEVDYVPNVAGEYAEHILCDAEDIPGSPFMAQILPKCYGPGLEEVVQPNEETHFTIDAREAGLAPLDVLFMDDYGEVKPLWKDENGIHDPKQGGILAVKMIKAKELIKGNLVGKSDPYAVIRHGSQKYTTKVVKNSHEPEWNYEAQVTIPDQGDLAVTIELFDKDRLGMDKSLGVLSFDTSRIVSEKVIEQGWYSLSGVTSGQVLMSADFVSVAPSLDKDARPEHQRKMSHKNLDVRRPLLEKKAEGLFECAYSPRKTQKLVICVNYGGVAVPDSPFRVTVDDPTDSNKVKVYGKGVEDGNKTSKPAEFTVDCDEDPVHGSPFKINAKKGCDPKRVKAYGPGLENGVCHEPNQFTIETRNAGKGDLGLSIEGPAEAKMTCKDNNDGSCNVDYIPTVPGNYDIFVKLEDKNIPGSPFKVPVIDPNQDANAAANPLSGSGLSSDDQMPNGKLNVKVIKAKELIKADVQISYGQQKFKTPTVKNSQEPKWDYELELDVPENHLTEVKFEVFDSDKSLGTVSVPISELAALNDAQGQWYSLSGVKSGKILLSADFTESDSQDTQNGDPTKALSDTKDPNAVTGPLDGTGKSTKLPKFGQLPPGLGLEEDIEPVQYQGDALVTLQVEQGVQYCEADLLPQEEKFTSENADQEAGAITNLFNCGLEEILQKIFLFLDPKSLKNSKSTCVQWRDFIDNRIWYSRSDSVKRQLHNKLKSNWKSEEPVKMINKMLPSRIDHLLLDIQVIMCGLSSGVITAFHADTGEQIYSISSIQYFHCVKMDICGDHLITAGAGIVQIFEKMTGKELYQSRTLEYVHGPYGVKMLKNVGVVSEIDGAIYFFRRGAKEMEWTEEKKVSGLHGITHIEGDDSRLLIGTYNGLYLWDHQKKKVFRTTEEPSLLTFSFPVACLVVGPSRYGIVVCNILTKQKVRHIEKESQFSKIHSNGRIVLLSEFTPSHERVKRTKTVVMYDLEELGNTNIKDADLWSRRMSFPPPYYSPIYAASNETKFAISSGKKLTVYDVWKDRDYEEVPDEE